MLKWFISPDGIKIPVADCLSKGLLSYHYPLTYLHLCADERPWTGKPSTTQLLNGTRMEYLKILTNYAIDPGEQIFRVWGTMAHKNLERFTPPESISEMEIEQDEITGVFDLLEQQVSGEWWLVDYKTWGSYAITKALGLVSKKTPVYDADSVYVKTDKEFAIDPLSIDMWIVELQLNRYRLILEKHFNIKIERMKLFVAARDGGLWETKKRGIVENTYYLDVRELDADYVTDYYQYKKEALLNALDGYNQDLNNLDNCTQYNYEELPGKKLDILYKNMPNQCNDREKWNGKRCSKYCPVVDACREVL